MRGSRGAVADRRLSPSAAREHRGPEAAAPDDARISDGVDPAVHAVEPARGDTALDRALAQTGGPELLDRDHAMLPRRDLGDLAVGWSTKGLTMRRNVDHPSHNAASPASPRAKPRRF